jgi:hypothetical protein
MQGLVRLTEENVRVIMMLLGGDYSNGKRFGIPENELISKLYNEYPNVVKEFSYIPDVKNLNRSKSGN